VAQTFSLHLRISIYPQFQTQLHIWNLEL
jgi:hypothetical protein